MSLHEIQRPKDIHQVIKRMLFSGKKPKDIARITQTSVDTVRNVKNCRLMKLALARMHEKADGEVIEVESRIQELLDPALDGLSEIIIDGTLDRSPIEDKDRIGVMERMLSRGGFPTTPNKAIGGVASKVGTTIIERVRARALELATDSGQIVMETTIESVTTTEVT